MYTRFAAAAFALALAAGTAPAGLADSLKKGNPDVKSAQALAFGPEGILFVGDPQGAAVFAIGTGDTQMGGKEAVNVPNIDEKIGSMLGTTRDQIMINDVKVNPASGNVYIAVARGKGAGAAPAVLRLTRAGKMEEVAMKDVPFAKATLPNPNDKRRQDAITGMAFVDNKLIVAGISNEEFASTLRAIPFPFQEAGKGAGIEIYHGAHGKLETNAPIQTLTTYRISGQDYLLASYTCTPLVKIPVSELKDGAKVKGTTVAELGNRNKPLDIVIYTKDGKNYALMANSARGVMKVNLEGIEKVAAITSRVADKAGLTYDTIADLKGVAQLDKLDDGRAVILVRADANSPANLQTIPLP
jgi:hypothetical protein